MARALNKYMVSKKAAEASRLSAPIKREKYSEEEISAVLHRYGHEVEALKNRAVTEVDNQAFDAAIEELVTKVSSDKPVEVSDEVGSW